MPTLAATYTFPLGNTVAVREGDWGEGVGGAGGTGAAAPHAPPLRAGGLRSPDDEAARHHLGMTSSRTTKIWTVSSGGGPLSLPRARRRRAPPRDQRPPTFSFSEAATVARR